MKSEKRIALISPSKDLYSETFIQAHKDFLNGQILHYYGSHLPTSLENYGPLLNSRPERILQIIKGKFSLNKFSLEELALMHSFKKEAIDIVFAEYGETASKILPVTKELRLPLIVHFHGYDASIRSVLKRNNYYREVFNYAHSVIAVSRKMYKDILDWGCPEEKLYYNPYGPNEDFFKLNPTFNKNQFLAVGRFVDKKAPYYILLAFLRVIEKFPNCNLVMAGAGELLETCRNLSKRLNLQDKIKFSGVLPPEEIKKEMVESLCFIQHSITAANGDSEGTPVVILEASAAGLPVISTRHAGIPDIVIDGQTGFLVDEHDVDGMAKRMIDILSSPSEGIKMGKEGSRNIRENFSISHHINLLNSLVTKAVTERV